MLWNEKMDNTAVPRMIWATWFGAVVTPKHREQASLCTLPGGISCNERQNGLRPWKRANQTECISNRDALKIVLAF
jgi:hypothetical protein